MRAGRVTPLQMNHAYDYLDGQAFWDAFSPPGSLTTA